MILGKAEILWAYSRLENKRLLYWTSRHLEKVNLHNPSWPVLVQQSNNFFPTNKARVEMQNSFMVIRSSPIERCPLKNYLLEDFSEEKNHDIAKNSLLDA